MTSQEPEIERKDGEIHIKLPPSTFNWISEFDRAIAILKQLKEDALTNRRREDPLFVDNNWKHYIEGIEAAIYRLQMYKG